MKKASGLAVVLLVFLFLYNSVLHADDSWDAAFLDSGVLAANIASSADWIQLSGTGKSAGVEERFRYTVERNLSSGWTITSMQKFAESRVQLDPRFQLKTESLSFKNPEMAKKIGMDSYTWMIEGRNANFRMISGGKEKSSKNIKLEPDTTFISVLAMQFNALVAGKRLESRVLSVMMGEMKIDAQVSFIPAPDPFVLIDKDYHVPNAVRHALPPGEYVVADFTLTGIFKTFYPHHFYFVYRKNGNWNYVASWSGKPSEASYQWLSAPK